jgi:3',5'-cyclic AMP phosphodiesterase CpdA
MLTLLHISDLHFGPPYLPKVGLALLRAAPQLNPGVIVVSGDLTQRAKRQQFTEAKEFLNLLPPVPMVIIPGNHDVPLFRLAERWLRPYQLYQEIISPELDHVARVDGAVIVALNSTAPRRHITNGRIYRTQLEFCTQAFRDSPPGAARIIVAHHHFAPAPDYQRDEIMPRAKRAMNHFIDLGVEMILGGHLHRGYIGNSLDIYPKANRHHGVIIVQCGTSTSRRGRAREREKNSFNLIRIGTDMVHITHYMYFDDADSFEAITQYTFPRPGKRLTNANPTIVGKPQDSSLGSSGNGARL